SGDYAAVKDLEFLYVFDAGGTMTESSNDDGAPPVPPAYGVRRAVSPGRFEARYTFFVTKPPSRFEDLASGSGWMPAGIGVLTESIALSADERSFDSTIAFEAYDSSGQPMPGSGRATGRGARFDFASNASR